MKRDKTLAALRRAITLAAGPAFLERLAALESPQVRVDLIERLARAHQFVEGSGEQRTSRRAAADQQRPHVGGGEGEGGELSLGTKALGKQEIPESKVPQARVVKPKGPQEYHLDRRFNLMLKAFPLARTGNPAKAFAFWKGLDTDRKAQLEVAIYDYLQKTKPEFYTQFVSLVESWVAQHPPEESK